MARAENYRNVKIVQRVLTLVNDTARKIKHDDMTRRDKSSNISCYKEMDLLFELQADIFELKIFSNLRYSIYYVAPYFEMIVAFLFIVWFRRNLCRILQLM